MKVNEPWVDVYVGDVAALQNDAALNAAYHRVPKYRKEKADALFFRKDKMLSLGTWLLLEKALAYRGVCSFEIGWSEMGKPHFKQWTFVSKELDTGEKLFFNLSHAGKRVLCVLSNREVGCDVEAVTDVDLGIAKRFFLPEEYELLMDQPTKEARNDLFFRLWTLKESILKFTGIGISLGLDSFRLTPTEDEIGHGTTDWNVVDSKGVLQQSKIDISRCSLKEYDFHDGYKYAICGQEPLNTFCKVVEII